MARKNRHNDEPGALSKWMNSAAVVAVIGAAAWFSPGNEKPEDKTVQTKTAQTVSIKAPKPVKYPAALAPADGPADSQGITPYPDADMIIAKSSPASPYAEGMITQSTDPDYEESMALAQKELDQLRQEDKQRSKRITTGLEKNPREERVEEEIFTQSAPQPDENKGEVSLESLNGTRYVPLPKKAPEPSKLREPAPQLKKAPAPVIREPNGKAAPVIKAEKPADPKIATHTKSSGLPQFLKRNDNGDHIYAIGPKTVPVPDKVMQIFTKVAHEKNLPIEVFIATCARESACLPRAVNKFTLACGEFQLMPTQKEQTLFRVSYLFGPYNGYSQTRDWITRYMVNADAVQRDKALIAKLSKAEAARHTKVEPIYEYMPKNAASKDKITELCLNPDFNTRVWASDLKYHIAAYEKFLKGKQPTGRAAVVGEIALINNLGVGDMKRLFRQVMADKKSGHDMMAHDFFKSINRPDIGEQNPSLVKFPDTTALHTDKSGKSYVVTIKGRDKTVRDVYNLVSEHGGWQTIAQLTPSANL